MWLPKLDKLFDGSVDICLVSTWISEAITLAYDIYRDVSPVNVVYIDEEGISYRFTRLNMTMDTP